MQTVALFAALAFSGYEIHKRRQELKLQNYLGANQAYAEAVRLMIEVPALLPLYDGDPDYKEFSKERKQRVLYCDWAISICETVWRERTAGDAFKKEWESWLAWLVWFHEVSEDFKKTWEWVGAKERTEWGMEYEEKFLEEVNAEIARHAAKKGAPAKP